MEALSLERTAYPSGWLSAVIGTAGLLALSVVLMVGGLVIAAMVPILILLLIGAWSVRTQVLFTKVHFRESSMVVHRLFGSMLEIPYGDILEIRRTFAKHYSGGGSGYALLIRFRLGSRRPKRILPGIGSIAWAETIIDHIRSRQADPPISVR